MTVKLNLGCGAIYLEGFINVDIDPRTVNGHKPDLVADIRHIHQHFEPNSVDAIFAAHVLEHLHPIDVLRCLVACWAILKPNGAIKVICPDMLGAWEMYVEKENDPLAFVWCVWGYDGALRGPHWTHLSGWTVDLMAKTMQGCGFDISSAKQMDRVTDRDKHEVAEKRDLQVVGLKNPLRVPEKVTWGHPRWGTATLECRGVVNGAKETDAVREIARA